MQKKLAIVSEVINFIMLYSVGLIIALFLARFLEASPSVAICLGMLFVMLASLAARKKIRKIGFFVLSHVLTIIPIILIPMEIYEKVFLVLYFIVFTLSDYVFWTRDYGNSFDRVHIAVIAEFICFSLIGAYLHMDDFIVLSYRIGVIFITLFAIRYFIDNVCKFFKEGKSVKNVPARDMMVRGFIPVIAFIVLAGLVMLLSESETISNAFVTIFTWIKDGIIKIILFFISHFRGEPEEVLQEELGRGGLDELANSQYIFPKWLKTLLYLIEKLFTAVILVAILYVALKGIVKWIRVYATRDLINSNGMNVKESEEKIENLRSRRRHRLFSHVNMSNSEKVRRYYRKKIISFKRKHYYINETQSPMERCDEINNIFETDISQLTDIYEKARYSDQLITNDMVNLIK